MASSVRPSGPAERQAAVEQLMLAEASLGEVEAAINKSALPEDEKAGLWLLGWSLTGSPGITHHELQQRLAPAG
jgi:hypothetical protein